MSLPEDWGRLRVVDVHAHLGSYGTFDLELGTLLENIDTWQVELALVSNLDGSSAHPTANLGPIEANRVTLETVRQHPTRLRGLIWANPFQGPVSDLESFAAATLEGDPGGERAFVGMKLHPDFDRFLADHSIVDPFLELCARRALVAVFHLGPPGGPSSPDRVYASARRHPTVPIVLYHLGAEGSHEAAITMVEESLRAGDADLYLGTAQASSRAVLDAVRRVGEDRVLFGTDATYFGKRHYEKYARLVGTLRAELSDRAVEQVMGGNARRLFRLD